MLAAGFSAAAMLAGPARAASPDPRHDPRILQTAAGDVEEADIEYYFRVLDINGDGRIDRTEYREQSMVTFFARDRNRDGVLDRNELPFVSEKIFTEADADGDGHISGYEWNQTDIGSFEAIDADGDGYITLEEWAEFRRRIK